MRVRHQAAHASYTRTETIHQTRHAPKDVHRQSEFMNSAGRTLHISVEAPHCARQTHTLPHHRPQRAQLCPQPAPYAPSPLGRAAVPKPSAHTLPATRLSKEGQQRTLHAAPRTSNKPGRLVAHGTTMQCRMVATGCTAMQSPTKFRTSARENPAAIMASTSTWRPYAAKSSSSKSTWSSLKEYSCMAVVAVGARCSRHGFRLCDCEMST